MYTAEVKMSNGTCILQAPTVEAMHGLIFQLNENIYINGTQVSAKDGKMPGVRGWFAGYTVGGLKRLYEEG